MKMKYIDTTIALVFILSMVIIYFLWGCHLDLYMTVLAGIVAAVAAVVRFVQYKKIKELTSFED